MVRGELVAEVHHGRHHTVRAGREDTLAAARAAHPDRFGTDRLGPAVWSVAVIGGDTIVAGGPSGLIAIRVTPNLILTDRPRRNLGIRAST